MIKILRIFRQILIALTLFFVGACGYNPYHFEEYKVKKIELVGEESRDVPLQQSSIEVDDVVVTISVETGEWATWETSKLGGPYRIRLSFLQFFDDSKNNYQEVLIKRISIHQPNGREFKTSENLPSKMKFEIMPTVKGTPKQNLTSKFLKGRYDFDFEKNVILEIDF